MIKIQYVRYIFLFLILSGCTSIGFLVSKKYQDRLKELKSFLISINLLKNKINFTHKPIGESFLELSKSCDNSNIGQIFLKTSQKVKKESFKKSWEKSIYEQETNLKKEDIQIIKTLANTLGKNDVEGEINGLNEYIYMIEKQIEKAEEEKNKNEKMYKSLGTIIGLGIVIVLF